MKRLAAKLASREAQLEACRTDAKVAAITL